MVQQINIPYTPRRWQKEFHNNRKRWNVLVLHRRAGKTICCLNELVKSVIVKPGRYAYISPTYKQSKNIAWEELKKFTRVIPNIIFNETELKVTFPNNATITLYGADNPDGLRGIGLHGVVFDEYSQQPPNIFSEVVRPCLSDNKGWAIWIGTPKGRNAFYDLYQQAVGDDRWFSLLLKASESGILDDEELLDARMTMSEAEFNQEYECSFDAAIKGAYYSEEIAKARKTKRFTTALFDKTKTVYTFWDIGVGDKTSIVFIQMEGNKVNIIDFYSNHGKGLDHYSKVLCGSEKGLERFEDYRYGHHYFPHDITQREFSTGLSRLEIAKKIFGSSKCKITAKLPVDDGINAARMNFNRFYFDEERCRELIICLEAYVEKWDSRKGIFTGKPDHNWASHAADAFRYMAVNLNKLVQLLQHDGYFVGEEEQEDLDLEVY